MFMHTINLRTAYVCASILVLRNPNSSFSIFVSLFLPYDMLLFCPYFMILSLCFFVCMLVCFNMLDYGFFSFLALIP